MTNQLEQAYLDRDLTAIQQWQLDALLLMQRRPAIFCQRLVEQLSFGSRSGQSWTRRIQIRLPSVTPADFADLRTERHEVKGNGDDTLEYIVSLGHYTRKRFPTFAVRDAHRRMLPLLTRHQHGFVLAHNLVRQFVPDSIDWDRLITGPDGQQRLQGLMEHLMAHFTSVQRDADGQTLDSPVSVETTVDDAEWTPIREALVAVLKYLEADDLTIASAKDVLADNCVSTARETQYLCWVKGTPEEIVQLEASYTTADSPSIDGPVTDEMPASYTTANRALGFLYRRHVAWRRVRRRAYARVGLQPLYYSHRLPSSDHTASYYFTVDPPQNTRITLLDWGHDRCFASYEAADVDCALHTCHLYNGESAGQGISIRPYLSIFARAEPAEHGRLTAVAILTAVLAILAQHGQFVSSTGTSAGQWILLAPLAVMVLIGSHRQHFYGKIMRALRYTLWGYVSLAALFALSLAFPPLWSRAILGRPAMADDIVSGLVLLVSVALVIALFASGPFYEWTTKPRFWRAYRRSVIYPGAWSWLGRLRRYPWSWPTEGERRERYEASVRSEKDDPPQTAAIYDLVCRAHVDRSAIIGGVLVLALSVMMVHIEWGARRAACVVSLDVAGRLGEQRESRDSSALRAARVTISGRQLEC